TRIKTTAPADLGSSENSRLRFGWIHFDRLLAGVLASCLSNQSNLRRRAQTIEKIGASGRT
ncbi:MAG: hypothetical protein ABSC24_09770, partial [Verrucomicrobiota bacterium]